MQRSPYTVQTVLDGQLATVLIKRFTREESFAFRSAVGANQRALVRNAERAKAATNEKEIQDSEEAIARTGRAIEAFEDEAVRRYVSLAPGHSVDEKIVTTGDDVVDAYGADRGVMVELFTAVSAVNAFDELAKNRWRKRHAFICGSAAASAELAGPRPDATAASAAPSTSAERAGA